MMHQEAKFYRRVLIFKIIFQIFYYSIEMDSPLLRSSKRSSLDKENQRDSTHNSKHKIDCPLRGTTGQTKNLQDNQFGSSSGPLTKSPMSPILSQVERECLRSIIEHNSEYFADKTKVCCSNKPTKHRLILPSHTGGTIYRQDFIPKDGFSTPTLKRFDQFKSQYPFMNSSSYKEDFLPHRSLQKKKSVPQSPSVDEAPRFLQTQYNGHFRNWGSKEARTKIEHPENYLIGVGQIANKSVYGHDFVSMSVTKEENCKYSDSTMFANWSGPKNSRYHQEFTNKPRFQSCNFKARAKYQPTVGLPNYDTQYKKQFEPKKKAHCSYKKSLSSKQIQDLILGL